MTIIRLLPHHAPLMAEVERLCFPVPWTVGMIRSELESDLTYYIAAMENGRLLGYAGMESVLDEGHINNVAVDPAFRRRGIASVLVCRLITRARELELSFLTLEARVSNVGARALYERLGFAGQGIRRGYYETPKEDAVIMTLRFLG